MGQGERSKADGSQIFMTQVFMERQNNVTLAVRSKATGTGIPGFKSSHVQAL